MRKIIERINKSLKFTPIKDELRLVPKWIKRNLWEKHLLEEKKEKLENELFYINGKLEQIRQDNEQLENWEKILKNRVKTINKDIK